MTTINLDSVNSTGETPRCKLGSGTRHGTGIAASRAVDPVTRLLTSAASSAVQQYALLALLGLLHPSLGNCQRFIDTPGSLGTLVRLLGSASSPFKVQSHASFLIRNLALHDSSAKQRLLVELEVVPILVSLLGSKCEELQHFIPVTLAEMLSGGIEGEVATWRRRAVAEGAIPLLVALLVRSRPPAAQAGAADALVMLWKDDADAQAAAVGAGAFPHLVHMLGHPSQDVHDSALGCLIGISRSAKDVRTPKIDGQRSADVFGREALHLWSSTPGALSRLAHLIESDASIATREGAVQLAAGLLAGLDDLGCSEEGGVIANGLIPCFVRLLQTSSGELPRLAEKALCNVAVRNSLLKAQVGGMWHQ